MAAIGEQQRYTTVAIWLHWSIAALLLFNLATGLTFSLMPDSWFGALIPFHISSGITVLALTAVRILWRVIHRPPPMLPMPAWQRVLAKSVYALFYIGMVAAPMTGWILISAHADRPPPAVAQPVAPGEAPAPKPHQTLIWGVVPLPKLAPVSAIGRQPDGAAKLKAMHEQFEERHELIGWLLLALFVLHVSGALKHQLIDRRRELARMGVGQPARA